MMQTVGQLLDQPEIEHCLSEEDLEFARAQQTFPGVPVVFKVDGKPVDIVTGQTQPEDTPEPEQICYFNFDMQAAELIAKATHTKACFRGLPN